MKHNYDETQSLKKSTESVYQFKIGIHLHSDIGQIKT